MIMKKKVKIQVINIFILLCTCNISCENMNTIKKYTWAPTASAPYLYTVEIYSAYMRYLPSLIMD